MLKALRNAPCLGLTALLVGTLALALSAPTALAAPETSQVHELAHEIALYDYQAVSICDPDTVQDARMTAACAAFADRIQSRMRALKPGQSLCLRTYDLKRDRAVWSGLPSRLKDVLDAQEWIILTPAFDASDDFSTAAHPDRDPAASCY